MTLGIGIGFSGGGGGGPFSATDTLTNGGFTTGGPLGLITLVLTGLPLDGETVSVGGVTYTFKDPFVDAGCNVAIGADISITLDNLISAINGGPGRGVVYATGCAVNAVVDAGKNSDTEIVVQSANGTEFFVDPPIIAPAEGKLPPDLTASPLHWWRADQGKAVQAGQADSDKPVFVWGSIGATGVLNGNANNPPLFDKDGGAAFNNQATIETSGARTFNGGSTLAIPLHIFLVFLATNSSSTATLFGSSNNFRIRFVSGTPNTIFQWDNVNGDGNSVPYVAGSDGVVLVDALFDGTTSSFIRKDRGVKSTGVAAGIAGATTLSLTTAANLAEIVVFSSEVVGQDYTDLTDYLAGRYGITLP